MSQNPNTLPLLCLKCRRSVPRADLDPSGLCARCRLAAALDAAPLPAWPPSP